MWSTSWHKIYTVDNLLINCFKFLFRSSICSCGLRRENVSMLSGYHRSFLCGHRCDEENTRKLCCHIRRGRRESLKTGSPEFQKKHVSISIKHHYCLPVFTHYISTDTSYTPRTWISLFRPCLYVFQITTEGTISYLVQCTPTYHYSLVCFCGFCGLRGPFAQNKYSVPTRSVIKTIFFVSVTASIPFLVH